MKRAVILGGTGVPGRATAWRLSEAGWAMDVTGRDGRRMPGGLADAGVRFLASDRRDGAALATVIGHGADPWWTAYVSRRTMPRRSFRTWPT